ncbi:hypothetical protein ACROYT_G005042 [Oculina patagonica]
MGKEEIQTFLFVTFVLVIYTKAQNSTFIPLPPIGKAIALSQYCESDGKIYNVGDEWKPNQFSVCKCAGPSAIQCSIIMVCLDHQQNQRQPGDRWLANPTNLCTCTDGNFVICQILKEPVCMDISGSLRQYGETWMNSSCVYCSCNNSGINCSGYNVNITHGLYSVELFPTCEKCDIPSNALGNLNTCKVYRELTKTGKLLEYASDGLYIRDIHQCNGIRDCPDGSDERGCDSVLCRDEEGNSFLITDNKGWQVSQCMNCHCKNGLLTCRRSLGINFPGYFKGIYVHNENCEQPQCNVAKFLREKKDHCEGVEFIKDNGIYLKDQIWEFAGCDFYFPGAYEQQNICPPMIRPVCYVYNGAICCASECPGLTQIANQLRGNLTVCLYGRQLASEFSHCRNSNHCLKDFYIKNCSSEVTCQDEDSIQYFDGAKWSVGKCMQCSCSQGKIHCSRKLTMASFLVFTDKIQFVSDITLTQHCIQGECNVANFMKRNNGVCHACRWNSKLYYDGDHWKENGVDFYCSSSNQKVRPGCYVENGQVTCTGAIQGIRELSLISNDDLFLCESGDEIISLGDVCNVRPDCDDQSDERNCDHYNCAPEKSLGFLWTRTRVDEEIIKQCSLIDSKWTGVFGSKCTAERYRTVWLHKNTCDCEKKTLVEYFKKKIAGVNKTNFMNVSQDMATSARAGNFTNPKAFHDMFKDLFHIVTRILTPLTLQNADSALQYCKHFIQTLLYNPIYGQKTPFCKPELAGNRNFLVGKALEFLRQAPKNTTAYNIGANLQFPPVRDYRTDTSVKDNFKPVAPTFTIAREQLILQLNTAPRLPTNVNLPTPIITKSKNNETTKNETSSTKNETTGRNMTNELTNQQIRDALRANNCTKVQFDEEKGVIVYSQEMSKESLKHEEIQSNMELVLICISISAVILALILLTALRLKRSERLFIHKSLLLSLCIGNLVFVLDKKLFGSRQNNVALCFAVTVVQFFFQTALFTWMLVEGINLYIKLVKVFSVKKQYVTYVAIGWGIPTVIVGLIAAIKPSTFDMGKTQYKDITCGSLKLTAEVQRNRCWINGSLWIYKGPILVILVANLVLFTILLRVIFGKISSKYGKDHVKISKKGLRSIVALLPLLGVTWLVGFFIEFHIVVGYVFILLNSTQGIVFFIFHCVLDDQVQEAVRKLFVKKQAGSRTRATPASNPNTTPIMERNSRVNIYQISEVEKETTNATIKNGTQHTESSL